MSEQSVTKWLGRLLAVVFTALPGCSWLETESVLPHDLEAEHYASVATQIEYPDDWTLSDEETVSSPAPRSLGDATPTEYRNLTLEDAVQQSLANSKVLRDLGGRLLRAPGNVTTVLDTAIQETDPRFGVEAALSAYDAIFGVSGSHEKNDFALNNEFFGGGARVIGQDASVVRSEISKLTMSGTEFTLRNNTDYDANTAPGNAFGSAWSTNLEAIVRYPLLRGAGVEFNRIAGPNNIPGAANGVLIARTNTDVSLADFELGVINFVSDVENAYWDLYFAYRDLDAKITARDAALETWRRVQALHAANRKGGEDEREAQAREQYFRFQAAVQDALSGRLLEGTRTSNGNLAGTFRGQSGVHVAERRLRLLLGLPITGGQLLRPADEPLAAEIVFDWDTILEESLSRRVELRRQRWLIKRREMELTANRNYLLPRLDTVGRYRWRGFGKDLIRQHEGVNGTFNNAWENLLDGGFQEWQLGLELTVPLGNRRAHAAVKNAELKLAREHALLREQEREVVHDLSNAVAEKKRAYALVQTNFNRRLAAKRQHDVLSDKFEKETIDDLDLVLEAQRRLADAESAFHRSRVEYAIAVKNVQYSKGTLLDYSQVRLSEGQWPIEAHYDSAERTLSRTAPLRLHWILSRPIKLSAGALRQIMPPPTEEPGQVEMDLEGEPAEPDTVPPPASSETEFSNE